MLSPVPPLPPEVEPLLFLFTIKARLPLRFLAVEFVCVETSEALAPAGAAGAAAGIAIADIAVPVPADTGGTAAVAVVAETSWSPYELTASK